MRHAQAARFRSIVTMQITAGAVLISLGLAPQAGAGGRHEGHDHGKLHFSHPLVGESPSPDTKVRVDYFFSNLTQSASGDQHTARFEAEYAFNPSLSLELDVPYTFLNPGNAPNHSSFDTLNLAIKYANFTFQEHGLLLGGGVELGLPTGDSAKGIGSSNVIEFAPFIDYGWKKADFETVGKLAFVLPFNENGVDESDLELEWSASMLYHITERIETLVELNGVSVIGGEEDGRNVANVTPGVKFAPFHSPNIKIGIGVSLPITGDRDFDVMPVVSIFYHF